jgi:hypothetical protein
MRDEELHPLPESAQFFHRNPPDQNHAACAKSSDDGQDLETAAGHKIRRSASSEGVVQPQLEGLPRKSV